MRWWEALRSWWTGEPSYRFFLVEMPEGEVIASFSEYEQAYWHRFTNRLGATRIMTDSEHARWTAADRPRPSFWHES